LDQNETSSTVIMMFSRKHFLQNLTQFSPTNIVVDTAASLICGFLWKAAYVS
jgi:hypothetical protein